MRLTQLGPGYKANTNSKLYYVVAGTNPTLFHVINKIVGLKKLSQLRQKAAGVHKQKVYFYQPQLFTEFELLLSTVMLP